MGSTLFHPKSWLALGIPLLLAMTRASGTVSAADDPVSFAQPSTLSPQPIDQNLLTSAAPFQTPKEPEVSVKHFAEASFDALWSSHIGLTESMVAYRQNRPTSDFKASLSVNTLGVDYEPARTDIITDPTRLREEQIAFLTSFRKTWSPPLTWLGSAGLYEGYSDYRSLWLNEYYRQVFSGVAGYRKAHPWGFNLSAGLRWEYLPASGFLELDGFVYRDNIAPEYVKEVIRPLQRGRETLHTTGLRLSLENVLTRRLRSLQEIQIAGTTDRELRYSYQGSLNWAAAEHWVLRSEIAASREDPQFNSVSLGATFEHDWEQRWFFSLMGRYYRDDGQIENPQIITSATPALETFQIGIGLRWQGATASFKVVAGPYYSRYGALERATLPFGKLYRDRDWVFAQAALAYAF
jgi:hypothetical protein